MILTFDSIIILQNLKLSVKFSTNVQYWNTQVHYH